MPVDHRGRRPSIQSVSNNTESHTTVLTQLKETVEIGQRLRGDPLDSYVKLRELQALGLARVVGSAIYPLDKILVTLRTGSTTATFSATNKPGTSTAGVIGWIPVVTPDRTEGYIPVFGK
jgi:hypothetical protein